MKKLILILLSLPIIGFGQEKSPCLDERYLEIKTKKLEDMSDREYAYFLEKEAACNKYLLSNKGLSENVVLGADKNINITYGTRQGSQIQKRLNGDIWLASSFYILTVTVSLVTDPLFEVPEPLIPGIGPFLALANPITLDQFKLPLVFSGLLQSYFIYDAIKTSNKLRKSNDKISYHFIPNPLNPSIMLVYNFD